MYQLASITNTASGSPVTYASYTYDALGQLTIEDTQDPEQKKYIRYDVTGKVTAVARDAAFTEMVVEYVYDELGQRIMKKTYNSSHHLIQNTYYVGDVIYTQPVVNDIPGTAVVQEYGIDGGGGRIGIYYRQSGIYAYQLTDHLGNVRAVVAKNSGTLEVRLYNDYYPFGMTITPGTTGTNDYRYGYQGQYAEKDPETDWNAFELRMYDSKIARWLSIDPKKQFHSPYVAMGNNPIGITDPTGGKTDDWVQRKDGSIYWDKNANNQATTKAGETYLGKTLNFTFQSFIDKELWDVPSYVSLGFDATGVKLTSEISITGIENANGELTSIEGRLRVIPGTTPIGTPRNYYPGKGGSNNVFDVSTTSMGVNINFEQHESVSKFEQLGLNMFGFKIVDVAQKLIMDYNRTNGNLSISSYTNIFPSATLKVNGSTIMQYHQPSFIQTHIAPIIGTSSPTSGSLPIRDFSYYPSMFYKR
ncbi:MAG: RHS repeat-associated core domain-containing protein [Sphingobacteriales bacterium]|nr:RHS repeat-associated core domain-containing protein [Sphingobacteriales bacterium]